MDMTVLMCKGKLFEREEQEVKVEIVAPLVLRLADFISVCGHWSFSLLWCASLDALSLVEQELISFARLQACYLISSQVWPWPPQKKNLGKILK